MALSFRVLYRNCSIAKLTQPACGIIVNNHARRVLSSSIYCRTPILGSFNNLKQIEPLSLPIRKCTSQSTDPGKPAEPPKKLSLMQRFKQMYRDYWYVLVPVHIATSTIWIGGLYYTVISGVDILGLMESMGVSQKLLEPLRDSKMGYFALTFALYKIVAPLRYAVTLGGTTYAIRRLTALGWIKPVPSRERLREMIQEKKDGLQDKYNEGKLQMKEKHGHVMDEMRRYKTEMQNLKNKVKKM